MIQAILAFLRALEAGLLAVFGAVVLALANSKFRKKVDA